MNSFAKSVLFFALTLSCLAAAPPATAPSTSPANATFKIALIGDSTVSLSSGWGPGFAKCLAKDTQCLNFAQNGRSSRSFLLEGHWKKCLDAKPNVILIQFGHNDQPDKGPDRATDPNTSYLDYMSIYIDEARMIGAQPILITSLSRRTWGNDNKIHSNLGPWVEAVKKLATDKKVPLLDLHSVSISLYEQLGKEYFNTLSPKSADGSIDNTHLNPKGSDFIGNVVASELEKIAPPTLAPHLEVPKAHE